MSRFRRLPPAGAPIGVGDLGAWARTFVTEKDPAAALSAAIRARVGARHCRLTCTGRAGLTLLLGALRALTPGREQVIIPSYTCFSVPAAVVKARLVPRLADIVPETLDFDHDLLEQADFSGVLAIVATNLYGFPNDMARLSGLARARGVFLIDDAAQALGAVAGGRPSGTWGDAGLYSFDKGKNLAAIDGGVIVSGSSRVIETLDASLQRLREPSGARVAADLLKVAAYAALLPPSRYWIPESIPALGLGRTRYTTAFALERPPRVLAALALSMLGHLESFSAARRRTARRMLDGLSDVPGVAAIRPRADTEPAYLRLPLLVADHGARQRVLDAVNREVGGATASYPTCIADIPELRGLLADGDHATGGRLVASRIVTLPTHPLVTADDAGRVVAAVTAALGRPSHAAAASRLRWSTR